MQCRFCEYASLKEKAVNLHEYRKHPKEVKAAKREAKKMNKVRPAKKVVSTLSMLEDILSVLTRDKEIIEDKLAFVDQLSAEHKKIEAQIKVIEQAITDMEFSNERVDAANN